MTNAVDPMSVEQQKIFDAFKGGKAFVKNGKWGFPDRSYYVAPQFDSLFTIC